MQIRGQHTKWFLGLRGMNVFRSRVERAGPLPAGGRLQGAGGARDALVLRHRLLKSIPSEKVVCHQLVDVGGAGSLSEQEGMSRRTWPTWARQLQMQIQAVGRTDTSSTGSEWESRAIT